MAENEQPRYTSGEFLQRLIQHAASGPVAFTSGGQAQIVVMRHETYAAMLDHIEELERLLELKQHKQPATLPGNGFIPLSTLFPGRQDGETTDE